MSVVLGSGEHRYRVVENWAKLPDKWEFMDVGAVAVDSKDQVYVFNRGEHPMMVFDRAGNFHSDALHVIERFTARSADTLMYEVTIEDPKVFTRPWKITMPLYRRLEKGIQLLEYECVDFAYQRVIRAGK